jgi:hypothetical protein
VIGAAVGYFKDSPVETGAREEMKRLIERLQ